MKATERKHLAGVVGFSRRGVQLFPGVDAIEAEGVVDARHRGTTTGPERCAVLWVGKELALVFVQGVGDRKDGRYSARVELVARHHGDQCLLGRWRQEVHVSDTEPETRRAWDKGRLWSAGRLVPSVIAMLIDRAKARDATFRADMDREFTERKRVEAETHASAQAALREQVAARELAERDLANKLIEAVESANEQAHSSGTYDRTVLVARMVELLRGHYGRPV